MTSSWALGAGACPHTLCSCKPQFQLELLGMMLFALLRFSLRPLTANTFMAWPCDEAARAHMPKCVYCACLAALFQQVNQCFSWDSSESIWVANPCGLGVKSGTGHRPHKSAAQFMTAKYFTIINFDRPPQEIRNRNRIPLHTHTHTYIHACYIHTYLRLASACACSSHLPFAWAVLFPYFLWSAVQNENGKSFVLRK